MDFSTWLKEWLSGHPVKMPELDSHAYTDQVMARIRQGQEEQKPSLVWSMLFPRLALAAVAASVVAVMLISRQPNTARLMSRANAGADAAEVFGQFSALAALDENDWEEFSEDDVAALLETSDEMELLMFAEDVGASSDQQWLEQTLTLLEQFDEEAVEADSGDSDAEDEWLQELEMLDTVDLTAKL